MAFQKGVSIMKHVTQQEYIITISPLETAFIAHFSSRGGALATVPHNPPLPPPLPPLPPPPPPPPPPHCIHTVSSRKRWFKTKEEEEEEEEEEEGQRGKMFKEEEKTG